jgi:hypothetical protein
VRIFRLRRSTPQGVSALATVTAGFSLMVLLFAVPSVCVAAGQNSSSPTKSDSQKAPTVMGQISGHVYRADDGAPIAMAKVTLTMEVELDDYRIPVQQSARTDGDGAYAFAQVPPGEYTLRAERRGYASRVFDRAGNASDSKKITVSAGQTIDKFDFRLFVGGAISGTVLDDENQPLEDAEVSAIRLTYHRGGLVEEKQVATVQSDDLGEFRLFDLPPGDYFVRGLNMHTNMEETTSKLYDSISAFRSTYYPGKPTTEGAQKVKVRPGVETSGVRFSLSRQSTYSISGMILDPTAATIPKRYFISPAYVGTGTLGLTPPAPNPDGTFLIPGVPSGEYILWAFALMTGPATDAERQLQVSSGGKIIQVLDNDVHTDVQIGTRGEVDGRVVIENSSGQSISGIGVTLLSELLKKVFDKFNNIYDSTTDQGGKFRITRVETGGYNFSLYGTTEMYLKKAVCNKIDYTFRPFTMDAGETFGDCVLTLANDTGVIKGQVLRGDNPVGDEVVVAIPESPSLRQIARYTVTGSTNAKGEYQLKAIVPGDYFLFAVPPDDAETYFDIRFGDRNMRDAERVSVKSSETKTVPLKPTVPQ